MKRQIFTILLFTILAFQALADTTFRLSAPSTVEVGDKFRVQFTVNSQGGSHFTPPSFEGFDVIYGPSTSSQSSMQIINGSMTQSSSVTYTYVLLASQAGSFIVKPASITIDGKVIRSNSATIKVLSNGQGGAAQSQPQQRGAQSSQPQQQSQVVVHRLRRRATSS